MNHEPDSSMAGETDDASLADAVESGPVWARVDDGFYVGSLPGRFLGCIDRQDDGEFLALDVYSQPIGTFPDLARAMEAVWGASIQEVSA